MNYFMKRENVNEYKSMLDDYDPMPMINRLEKYLKVGDSILEIGMGAGLDYDILSKKYSVVGTDNSPIFIEDYKAEHPNADVRILDATNITIPEKFDCIFSNKVLHHLTKDDFIASLSQQKAALKTGGIIFMTLWHGEEREELMFNGEIRFTYYMEETIKKIAVKEMLEILTIERYSEMDDCDSMVVVLKKV